MVNKWNNLERPGVVMENGHVVAFTFAATDIDKSSITGTDNHGSKIIMVPFDGAAFDKDNGGETGTAESNRGPEVLGETTAWGLSGGKFKISPQGRDGSIVAIEFAIPHSYRVIIKMYDLAGNERLSLVNQYLNAGSYRFCRDIHAFARGCSVIRLQARVTSCTKTIQFVH